MFIARFTPMVAEWTTAHWMYGHVVRQMTNETSSATAAEAEMMMTMMMTVVVEMGCWC